MGLIQRLSPALRLPRPSGNPTPNVFQDWSGINNQAQAEAWANWFGTDYTYWGTSDGLQIITSDGDPWSGSPHCIQANQPVGAQGFASGGGFAYRYASGAAPVQEVKLEVTYKFSPGWSPAGTGPDGEDYKNAFDATGDSYNGLGDLISTGRGTIGKAGNQGLVDRVYSYPNTSFDTLFLQLLAAIGSTGWIRQRLHHRVGAAGQGIWWCNLISENGDSQTVQQVGYNPNALYLGYGTLGNNLNKFITQAQWVRWGAISVWLPGNFPTWGYAP